jgi:hypothetical protein
MAERTKGDIEICWDHPNPETAASLISIRPVQRNYPEQEVASVYCARVGTEQEANAEFFVRAWNSHDKLVEALEAAQHKLNELRPQYTDVQAMSMERLLAQVEAALAAARELP